MLAQFASDGNLIAMHYGLLYAAVMRIFQWGVLSTAKIGRELVIPEIQESNNGVVAAIASRDLQRARELAQRFAIPKAYGSYDELLEDPKIDGVYVPLPTAMHLEWSHKILKSGKHVLCEKPLALRAADILSLIETRNATGLLASEAFMVTYHPQWLKVRELLAEGAVGKLRQVQAAFSYYNVDPSNMRNQLDLGGGGLPDIGVYPTVLTRFVTGTEPQRVRACVERDPKFGTDIYADVRADFGHFMLSFYCATQLAARQSMIFHGDKGYLEVSAPFNAVNYGTPEVRLCDREHAQDQIWRFTGVKQYQLQCEAFAHAAFTCEASTCETQNSEHTVFSLEDSYRNQKLIDAVYRAAEEDAWVELAT